MTGMQLMKTEFDIVDTLGVNFGDNYSIQASCRVALTYFACSSLSGHTIIVVGSIAESMFQAMKLAVKNRKCVFVRIYAFPGNFEQACG